MKLGKSHNIIIDINMVLKGTRKHTLTIFTTQKPTLAADTSTPLSESLPFMSDDTASCSPLHVSLSVNMEMDGQKRSEK